MIMNELDPRYLELYSELDETTQYFIRRRVADQGYNTFLAQDEYEALTTTNVTPQIKEKQEELLGLYLDNNYMAKETIAMISLREAHPDLLKVFQSDTGARYPDINDGTLNPIDREKAEAETLDMAYFIHSIEDKQTVTDIAVNLEFTYNPEDKRSTVEKAQDAYLFIAMSGIADSSLYDSEYASMLSEDERNNEVADFVEIRDDITKIYRNMDPTARQEVMNDILNKDLSAQEIAKTVIDKSMESIEVSEGLQNKGTISFDKLQEMQKGRE